MKGKKIYSVLLILVLMLSMVVGCSNPDKNAGNTDSTSKEKKTYELKFTSLFGPTHAVIKQVIEPWAQEVEKATDGRVKITIYPVDTLLKATDIYEGVISGVADIGLCDPGYNVGRFPLMSCFFLGGMEYKNSKVASYVAWDLVKEMNLQETKDTRFLFVYGLQSYSFITKKPIKTLENMKGLQVRISGFASDAVSALGGVPVGMPMSETYEGLLKGTIDAALVPTETLKGWKFAEITKYTTKAPFVSSVFHYITMNLDVWNSLPADIQQKFEEVNKKTFEEASTVFDQICNEGEKYAVEQFKNEIITLSDVEKEKWLNALSTVQDKWVKDMEGKGLPGKETLEKVKESAAKHNELYGTY